MKRRMTIVDVAREAGVSKTAVSFAFNSPERLAASTLTRILEISVAMGYVPSPMARGLARSFSGALGVLVPHTLSEALAHPYFQELLQGIGAYCQKRHLKLSLIPPVEGCLLKAVRDAAVDGVVTLGFTPSRSLLELLEKRALPLVTVDSRVDLAIPSVRFQDRLAALELMVQILNRGYRRLHILSGTRSGQDVRGNSGSRAQTNRLLGFREALESTERPNIEVTNGESLATCDSARDSLLTYPWSGQAPEVIVCLSDIQAAGAYLFAEARGLKIPQDLAVTGFDGSLILKHLRPALWTIRQSGALKGRLAAELLESQWKNPSEVRHLVLKPRLIEGPSLGYPAGPPF